MLKQKIFLYNKLEEFMSVIFTCNFPPKHNSVWYKNPFEQKRQGLSVQPNTFVIDPIKVKKNLHPIVHLTYS